MSASETYFYILRIDSFPQLLDRFFQLFLRCSKRFKLSIAQRKLKYTFVYVSIYIRLASLWYIFINPISQKLSILDNYILRKSGI